MSGDAHVQFWESLGVRFPGATAYSNRTMSLNDGEPGVQGNPPF